MRSDIDKVICERPRHRGWSRSNFRARRVAYKSFLEEDTPMRIPMKDSRRGGGDKSLSDFLSPLYRFIRKSVGRKWNDVYSEISRNLDRSKQTHQHVLDHLRDWVVTRTVLINGKVFSRDRWGERPIEKGSGEYFVHPVTGVLTLNENNPDRRWKEAARKRHVEQLTWEQQNFKQLSLTEWLVKHHVSRTWFYLRYEKRPPAIMMPYVTAAGTVIVREFRPPVAGKRFAWPRAEESRRPPVFQRPQWDWYDGEKIDSVSVAPYGRLPPNEYYLKEVRQLSKRELRVHHLR